MIFAKCLFRIGIPKSRVSKPRKKLRVKEWIVFGALLLAPSGRIFGDVATFTSSGSWTVPAGVTSVNVLVIAGGGGGGANNYGGGGGGGGLIYQTGYVTTPGASISYTVGSGGTGGNWYTNSGVPAQGQNSTFDALTAVGGGTGGSGGGVAGGPGGSGGGGNGQSGFSGGGGGTGTTGQGYGGGNGTSGSNGGGGGGGAAAAGPVSSTNTGGTGGTGYASSISGPSVTYGGGGGGGGSSTAGTGGAGGGGNGSTTSSAGSNGTANTGGGGGGGGAGNSAYGGNGGSGIVIVYWDVTPTAAPSITSSATSNGIVNQPIYYQVTASNYPASFGASGLPSGMTINTVTGQISGTPTVTGTYSVSLSATNSLGTGTGTVSIYVGVQTGSATFTSSGTWTVPAGATNVNVLVVGGGGGAGANNYGGGGGGGGVIYKNGYGTTPGATLSYTVGSGGTGGNWNTNSGVPTQGQNSTFDALTAVGGGKGGSGGGVAGGPGGSGGGGNGQSGFSAGSGGLGTSGQGYGGGNGASGSNGGGGGGGATAAGAVSSTSAGGNGGAGYVCSISGSSVTYGGGGGGGGSSAAGTGGAGGGNGSTTSSPGSSGTANIGGGGGGGGAGNSAYGGNGGSGVVNIAWSIPPTAAPSISSPSTAYQTVGGGFSYQITANNSPASYSATGLPTGLSINTSTGLISGTPTVAGTYSVTVGATNALGTNTSTLTLSVWTMYTTGMKLWLNADTGISLTTSGGATTATWADQSGQGNSATEASSSAPSVVTNSINGHSAVHFTAASSQFLTVPALLSGVTSGEVFVVLRTTTNMPSGSPLALYQFGPGHGSAMPNTDGIIHDDFLNGSTIQEGPPPVSLTSYNLYNASAATGQWTSRFNGALLYSTTSNSFSAPTSGLVIGANVPTYVSDFFDGDIAEMIVYGQALTDAQRTTVGQYLQAKYALPAISTPSAPTSPTATAVSSTQMSLTWTDAFATAGVTYSIQRATGGGSYATVGQISNAQSFIDTGLTAGTAYSYQVFSQTYAGTSATSGAASATTLASTATDMPLSGMKLWLRADAGIDNGLAPISYWRDQSGLGNDAGQLVVGNEPSLVGNVINGRPVVHFTASGSKYMTTAALMSGMTAGDVFVVFRATTSTPTGSPLALYQFGPGHGSAMPNTDGNLYDDFLNSSQLAMGAPPFAITSFNLYNAMASSSQWVSWFDCVPLLNTTSNLFQAPTGGLVLGANVPTYVGDFFDGDIAELILYNSNLASAQRATVVTYLQNKYGLTIQAPNIPVGLFAQEFSSTQIDLLWASDPTTGTYTIQRSVDGGTWAAIASVNGPVSTYVDASVPSGNVIRYRIQGTNGSASAFSDPVLVFMSPSSIDPIDGLPYWLDEILNIDPTLGSDALPGAPTPTPTPTPPSEDSSIHTGPTVILNTPSQASLH